MKIIAHSVTNMEGAKNAIKLGCNFVEIDIAKQFLIPRFVIRHNGVLGKLGIGESINKLLDKNIQDNLYLDLKLTFLSLTFKRRFSKVLKKIKLKNVRICGRDWEIVSDIAKKNNLLPFYTIASQRHKKRIDSILPNLTKPAGFSIRHKVLDKELIKLLKTRYPTCEIWAWVVNSKEEIQRMKKLGVDGITTDMYRLLLPQTAK